MWLHLSKGSISVLLDALAELRGASFANGASKEVRENRDLTSGARFFDLGRVTVSSVILLLAALPYSIFLLLPTVLLSPLQLASSPPGLSTL